MEKILVQSDKTIEVDDIGRIIFNQSESATTTTTTLSPITTTTTTI